MNHGTLNSVLQNIRRLAAVEEAGHLSDGQLLEQFRARRDETAFAILMHRHGPMVWRVCLRVLQHRQNAEDVFQATFLTLARKAASIRKLASVVSWLHGVAYRLSRRLQAALVRQYRREAHSPTSAPGRDPAEQAGGQELQAILDEELARLSARLRLPLILCYLEGKTRDEAAASLGWSLSTVKRQLERGLKLLAARLQRRGLSLGVALLSAAVVQDTVWAMGSPTLFNSTCATATGALRGTLGTGMVSGRVAALTERMVRTLTWTPLKRITALVLALALLVGGAGLWTAHQMAVEEPAAAPAGPAAGPVPAGQQQAKEDLAVLIERGNYLVNQVARCGDCHTPHNAKGELDLAHHLQGADIWFTPKVKFKGEWEKRASDITASGKASKWSEEKLIQFLSTGPKTEPPMPSFKLTQVDAQAVAAYLRSLPGKMKAGAGKKTADD
jgi:RNA polymerase sigma factor (sigma-70 family)